jgi:hypothetical protein
MPKFSLAFFLSMIRRRFLRLALLSALISKTPRAILSSGAAPPIFENPFNVAKTVALLLEIMNLRKFYMWKALQKQRPPQFLCVKIRKPRPGIF